MSTIGWIAGAIILIAVAIGYYNKKKDPDWLREDEENPYDDY